MANKYVNQNQAIHHIENDELLVGNNAEWAKEAIYKSDSIEADNIVFYSEIEATIKYCEACAVVEEMRANFGKVKAYEDIIDRLKMIPTVDESI